MAKTKFAIHYLGGSQTPAFSERIRNEIRRNKQTTWANTDTMLGPNSFFKGKLNQKIARDELGILKLPLAFWACLRI